MEQDQKQHVVLRLAQQQRHIVEMESYKVMSNVIQEVQISEMDVIVAVT
jgi:hypothetical protein